MGHPGRDPESSLEDEGIPDLQDGTPGQQWASDPQQQPVPGDEPMAVDEYGTTAEEQREPESLNGRLAREEAEPTAPGAAAAAEPVARVVEPDQGAAPDTEKDMIADEVGPDAGGYGPEERAVHIEDPNELGPGRPPETREEP
jgi:hypothetical protein